MELAAFFSDHGLTVGTPELDGKVHRCDREGKRSKSAWYIGWSQPYTVCVAGDWRTGEKWEYKTAGRLSKEDKAGIKEKVRRAIGEAAAERERQRLAARKAAARALAAADRDVGTHPYLERKAIRAFSVYKLDSDLLVPVRDMTGTVWGYQRILPDGKKLFLSGQRVEGCFHLIEGTTDRVFVVEGYATGATVHMATGGAVYCAFHAGNLVAVAKQVRQQHPEAAVTVAGDDDQWSAGNPGRTKATEAAQIALGSAAFPQFTSQEGKPTDFNDLHSREGLDVVKAQLNVVTGLEKSFVPLGYDEQTCFVYSFESRSVVKFSSFAKTQFYMLAPRTHWEKVYPKPHGKEDSIDWELAKDELIAACKRIGPFDATRLRGSGVWLDRGRIVLNTARELVVGGVPQPITRFSTTNVYVNTRNQLPKPSDRPLTAAECAPLVAACERFKWKHPKYAPYLAGWLAVARVAGALPVRPHVWLTGGSGTGKSTAMDRLIRPALGDDGACLYAQGGTTEAGLRQMVRADSIPVIFDEFEASKATMARVEAIVELLRQSWSFTGGAIVKGGGDGVATVYQLAFAALVSSIKVCLGNDADRSRFTVLELAPHGSDRGHWVALRDALAVVTPEYGERLFARAIKMTPIILENFKVFSHVLSARMGQRFAAQHGMLLAGYGILITDQAITASDAEAFVDRDFDLDDDKNDIVHDHEECFETIMTRRIRVPCASQSGHKGDVDMTIGDVIASGDGGQQQALRAYGVHLEKGGAILVANQHDSLRRTVFADTKWVGGWHRSLMRIPGAEQTTPKDLTEGGRKSSRCTRIPRSYYQ